MQQRYDNFYNKIIQSPYVTNVSSAINVPSENINNNAGVLVKENNSEEKITMGMVSVNYDFFKVLNAEILEGRTFSKELSSEENKVCILNETAVKTFNLTDPIGKNLTGFFDESTKRIIGVVKDIHYRSFHENVTPMVYFVSPEQYPPNTPKIIIRLKSENIASTLKQIKTAWNETAPEWPFDYFFVDKQFQHQYEADKRSSTIIDIFTGLALFISLLGLFGLIAYVVTTKTKEIGIRKVLGASIPQIVFVLGKEFFILTVIANIIAWPIAWLFTDNWLQNFVYHTDIVRVTGILSPVLSNINSGNCLT